uniref:Uncharacterized protein n=1 Tax=Sphaerodactylus townsendi TaxID=933632 RepID=A0ACB8F4H0_9SAUR
MLSQSQEAQAPLLLSHVQPEVFLAVIEYLYTNSVTFNNAIALEVLTSSIEYGLNDLRKFSSLLRCSTVTLSQMAAVQGLRRQGLFPPIK